MCHSQTQDKGLVGVCVCVGGGGVGGGRWGGVKEEGGEWVYESVNACVLAREFAYVCV